MSIGKYWKLFLHLFQVERSVMRLIIYIELATLGANENCLVNYRSRILHRVRSATLHCQEKAMSS